MKAHFRLITTLPVRTHLAKSEELRACSRTGRTPEVTKALVLKYREEGWGYTAIKRELKISTATISNIVNGRR